MMDISNKFSRGITQ